MEFYETVRQRYSCRRYRPDPVEPEKLERLLEAARLAPSAANRQEWRFIIVKEAEKRQRLMKAAQNQTFVGEAPVVIVAAAATNHHVMRCGEKCYPIDVAIALEHLALAATAEGLGTCWIGAVDADQVREICAIPPEVPIVDLMTLGYPADRQKEKKRLPLAEIVMEETWRG